MIILLMHCRTAGIAITQGSTVTLHTLQALVLLETQPGASVPEISDRCFLLRSKRTEILYRPYLASSIAFWCLPIFVELLRDELAACVSNSLCTFLLFSSLLFSIDWIIFFFTPGWFCKHGVKTSIRTRKIEKRGGSKIRSRT